MNPKRQALALLIAVCAIFILGGCSQTKLITDPILGPDYTVKNVFRKDPALPATLRRVALLPMTSEDVSSAGISGTQILEPVMMTELSKVGKFEWVHVKPAELSKWTGKERWDHNEILPNGFITNICAKTGADGVLFIRLSRFHAYPPMVIGWRMTLADAAAQTLWSVDEVFDAAEEPVSNSARRYDRAQIKTTPALEDSRSILLSPRRFGQYTAHAVVQTLPSR